MFQQKIEFQIVPSRKQLCINLTDHFKELQYHQHQILKEKNINIWYTRDEVKHVYWDHSSLLNLDQVY